MAELPEYFEFEFTVKGKYRVHRDNLKIAYGTSDPELAAGIDEQNLRDDPATIEFFIAQDEDLEFEVRPVGN